MFDLLRVFAGSATSFGGSSSGRAVAVGGFVESLEASASLWLSPDGSGVGTPLLPMAVSGIASAGDRGSVGVSNGDGRWLLGRREPGFMFLSFPSLPCSSGRDSWVGALLGALGASSELEKTEADAEPATRIGTISGEVLEPFSGLSMALSWQRVALLIPS